MQYGRLSPRHIAPGEYFHDLALKLLAAFTPFSVAQGFPAYVKQIIIQGRIPEPHFGMENVFLVYVHVDHLVTLADITGEEVLNGIYFMINKMLSAAHIPGKAPHPVIKNHNIGFKAVNEVIQGLQRGNTTASLDVDIRAERTDTELRVTFRIGVDGDMAFIKVTDNSLRQRSRDSGIRNIRQPEFLLRDQ